MTIVPVSEAELMPAAPRDTDSWVTVVAEVSKLAGVVAETDFVPKALRGNAAAITAAILYGREVGLPPMTALRSVNVIEGRPALSAEVLRSLILAAGHEIEYVVSNGTRAVVRGRRRGRPTWHEVEWTMDIARAAGLAGKQNWQRWPRAMLKARATSELARDYFADVVGGFAATEEFDVMPEDAPPEALEAPKRKTGTVSRGKRSTAGTGENSSASGEGSGHPEHLEEREPAHTTDSPEPAEPGPTPTGLGEARPNDAGSGESPAAPARRPRATTIARAHRDMPKPEPAGEHDGWSDVPLPLDDERELSPEDAATPAQGRHIFALLRECGIEKRPERLEASRALLGRPVDSFASLTVADASSIIDALILIAGSDDPHRQLAGIVTAYGKTVGAIDMPPPDDEPDYDPATGEVLS